MKSNIEKIKRLLKTYAHVKQCQKRLGHLQGELKKEKKMLAILDKKIDKELKDVLALETTSLPQLFSKILGNPKQQLEKERQEYLVAVMEYNECLKVVELIEYEIDVLQNQISDEEYLVKDINRRLLATTQDVLLNDSVYLDEYKTMVQDSKNLVMLKVEIDDAKDMTMKLRAKFQTLVRYIKIAREGENWGQTYLEKQISKRNKKDAIDNAQSQVYIIKKMILLLKDELQDVDDYQSLFKRSEAYIVGFNIRYYNDLIADWVANANLNETLHHTIAVQDILNELIRALRKLSKSSKREYGLLSAKREQLIETIANHKEY